MTLTKEMIRRVFPGVQIVPSEAADEPRDADGRLADWCLTAKECPEFEWERELPDGTDPS